MTYRHGIRLRGAIAAIVAATAAAVKTIENE